MSNLPAPTKLGSRNAGAASPQAAPASPLGPSPLARRRQIVGGRRGAPREIAGLGPTYIELPGSVRFAELESEAHKRAAELAGDGADPMRYAVAYETQLAIRVLAEAVRDPDDKAIPYGTLGEWGELDNDLLNAAWHTFGDVREELDPIERPITPDEMIAIGVAVKKKDPRLLRTYGVAKLSLWLASMGDPQSSSPQPSSPNTESPSD